MSSPHKFRVWSKARKQWITHISILCSDGVILNHWVAVNDAGQAEHQIYLAAPLEPILDRWTGLLDINGAEIYENDLIRHESDKIGLVIWEGEEMDSRPVGWVSSHSNENVTPCVVVGNIHENPEPLISK